MLCKTKDAQSAEEDMDKPPNTLQWCRASESSRKNFKEISFVSKRFPSSPTPEDAEVSVWSSLNQFGARPGRSRDNTDRATRRFEARQPRKVERPQGTKFEASRVCDQMFEWFRMFGQRRTINMASCEDGPCLVCGPQISGPPLHLSGRFEERLGEAVRGRIGRKKWEGQDFA